MTVAEGDFGAKVFDAFELGVAGGSDTDSGLVRAFVVGECLREG